MRRRLFELRTKQELPKTAVAIQWQSSRSTQVISLDGRSNGRRISALVPGRTQREPVSSGACRFAHQKTVALKGFVNRRLVPSGHFFQDRNQHGKSIGTDRLVTNFAISCRNALARYNNA